MLVLGRKIGETIVIGDVVVVKVMAVQGGRVRLGVDAPASIHVLREEVAVRAKAGLRETAVPTPGSRQED